MLVFVYWTEVVNTASAFEMAVGITNILSFWPEPAGNEIKYLHILSMVKPVAVFAAAALFEKVRVMVL